MKEQEGVKRRKRHGVNSSEGAVWFGQVETHTGTRGEGAQREWMRGDEEDGEEEEYRAPVKGQAPARRFRPHGPSRHWEYQTLWLPKTHRVWLGLWARTVSHSAALDCVGCCVSARPLQSQINTSPVTCQLDSTALSAPTKRTKKLSDMFLQPVWHSI